MIYGFTHDEIRRLKESKKPKSPSRQEDKNEQEVRKGYQKHWAMPAIRLVDGRYALKEFVYRHRRWDKWNKRWYWEYHEGDLGFRFHVMKGVDMSAEEVSQYYKQRGWKE